MDTNKRLLTEEEIHKIFADIDSADMTETTYIRVCDMAIAVAADAKTHAADIEAVRKQAEQVALFLRPMFYSDTGAAYKARRDLADRIIEQIIKGIEL